jgi:surface antigen
VRRAAVRNARLAVACLTVSSLALALGGCAVSIPLESMLPNGHAADATGTVSNGEIKGYLDGEDWHRAKGALVEALDPQGPGATVRWSNPASGAKGFFAADGKVYPTESGICRAFVADVDRNNTDSSLHGTACADKAGEWTVTDVKQGKKG